MQKDINYEVHGRDPTYFHEHRLGSILPSSINIQKIIVGSTRRLLKTYDDIWISMFYHDYDFTQLKEKHEYAMLDANALSTKKTGY